MEYLTSLSLGMSFILALLSALSFFAASTWSHRNPTQCETYYYNDGTTRQKCDWSMPDIALALSVLGNFAVWVFILFSFFGIARTGGDMVETALLTFVAVSLAPVAMLVFWFCFIFLYLTVERAIKQK